jgi:cytochrome subunit of sulfide dehydrogenase
MIARAAFGAAVLLGTVAAAPPQNAPGQSAPGESASGQNASGQNASGQSAPPPGASTCSGCHGTAAPPPVLAGRDPVEIVADLDAFRAGTRPATVMDRIAKGFTHDESVAIATWLAAQR